MLMLFIPAWFIVLIGMKETAFRTTPVENAVYPAIAPWTAFCANLAHIIVSYAFAATDRIAYVGSMYFKFTLILWFSFSFYTIEFFKYSPKSSSFTFPEPSFFTSFVMCSSEFIKPTSAPSAITTTACPCS